jgi:E3 ubiquitin-protein ligase DOA10
MMFLRHLHLSCNLVSAVATQSENQNLQKKANFGQHEWYALERQHQRHCLCKSNITPQISWNKVPWNKLLWRERTVEERVGPARKKKQDTNSDNSAVTSPSNNNTQNTQHNRHRTTYNVQHAAENDRQHANRQRMGGEGGAESCVLCVACCVLCCVMCDVTVLCIAVCCA